MTRLLGRSTAPRWDAGNLLTTMAVCFGVTVVLTRIYLISTGYPKIGGGVYHIAHALFGGLALVIAVVVALVFADQAALTTSAVLAGVGLGLFIDEVGKFITADNDYFFPLAAPIIYLAFLGVVLAARRAGRMRATDATSILLGAAAGIAALLRGGLSAARREAVLAQLDAAARAPGDPDSRAVARDLAGHLRARPAGPDRHPGGPLGALTARLHRAEVRLLPEPLVRRLLLTVVVLHALWSALRLVLTLVAATHPFAHLGPFAGLVRFPEEHGWKSTAGWVLAVALEGVASVLYARAAVVWFRGREAAGVRTAIGATVLTLTAVNVLNSYFHQFTTLFTAVAEGALLLGLLRYRSRAPADISTPPRASG